MELPTTNDRKRDTSIIQEFLRSTEATSKRQEKEMKIKEENERKTYNSRFISFL